MFFRSVCVRCVPLIFPLYFALHLLLLQVAHSWVILVIIIAPLVGDGVVIFL